MADSIAVQNALTLTDEQRAALIMKHPLMTRDVILETEPAMELYRVVSRAVIVRELGICFGGPSGIGKSKAIGLVVT